MAEGSKRSEGPILRGTGAHGTWFMNCLAEAAVQMICKTLGTLSEQQSLAGQGDTRVVESCKSPAEASGLPTAPPCLGGSHLLPRSWRS